MNWIMENWKLILLFLGLAVAVADLLVSLFRKKAILKDNDLVALVKQLPNFIIKAESTGLKGREKREAVVYSCLDFLHQITGEDKDFLIKTYSDVIVDLIEKILECPKKKEVIIDEDK